MASTNKAIAYGSASNIFPKICHAFLAVEIIIMGMFQSCRFVSIFTATDRGSTGSRGRMTLKFLDRYQAMVFDPHLSSIHKKVQLVFP